jgi:uncharacterized protein
MRLLVDTNIVLEVILEQEKAEEAQSLLAETEQHSLFLTDYSLHSIGLLLFRRKKHHVFQQFVSDMMVNAGMKIISIKLDDLTAVVEAAERFNLDFDDAYQYAAAARYNLILVSFDSDFDRTDSGRKTPAGILFRPQ